MNEVGYLTAFLVGLVGGVHCVGMCSGIVGALTFSLPEQQRGQISRMMPYQLAYNLGRMTSYVVAGGVMGGLGMLISELLPVYYAQRILLGIAGLFMLLLGLYLADWWRVLTRLEQIGGRLWRRLEPVSRRLLPVRTPGQALLVGLVWGWIPCGLVYSMLAMAVSAGGPLQGAGLMFAFALGTLPALLTMGVLAGAAAHLSGSIRVRRFAGLAVILFGIYTIWQAF